MTWANVVQAKSKDILFKAAWSRAQAVRAKTEELSKHFFEELVTVGIDVLGPPKLGQFTPSWEPLSNSWLQRKLGGDGFFYNTGALARALLRKSTTSVFGNPVVMLSFETNNLKVTAATPAKRYADETGPFKITVTPFPRVTDQWHVEDLVATPGSKTFYKLVNPKGKYLRPLVSPFMAWYINVKLKAAFK